MIDNDVAYSAGLFDGEGHIAIVHQKASKKESSKSRYDRYFLSVSMSQNNREVMVWLCDKFGGNMRYVVGKRSYDGGTYHRWNWCLSCNKAAWFLRKIHPFSIVKSEEISIALAFQDTMNRNTGRARVASDVLEFRKYCHQEIRRVRGTKKY